MTLAQMRLVKILAENGGNISQAAEKLNIAQSALSRRLQQLEVELYHQLFYRHGKRLGDMTDFGVEILTEINRILICEHNIEALAADYSSEDRGTLIIATTHAQARYFLPTPLVNFRKKYPMVNLRFQQGQPKDLLKMLEQREVDFVICTENLDDNKTLSSEILYPWKHILAAPQGHEILTKDLTLEMLSQYPLLTYIDGITGRVKLSTSFKQAGIIFNPVFSASDSDVLIEYINTGFGLGILCGMAQEEIEKRGLAVRSLRQYFPQFETRTAWLKHRKLRRFEKTLLKELTDYAQHLDWRELN